MDNKISSRKKHPERKEEIIDAAITLIGKGGIQMLTTKNLAREVSVSEPALYRHFSDKIDILRQVLDNLRERIRNRLESITQLPDDPETKLGTLIERQFTAFSQRPEVVVVLLSEGMYQNNRELSDLVYSIMQDSAAIYTRVIADGQASGMFRGDIPADRLTFLVMGAMRFCVIQWHLSGYAYDLRIKGGELKTTLCSLLTGK